jgi:hypothetical protein
VLVKRIELFGLAGFTLSGTLFVISGLRSGDPFAIAGSVVWIVSCVGWMIAIGGE